MPFLVQKQLTRNIEKFVRSLYQKKYRREYNMCVCEGLRACRELYSLRPGLIEYGITLNDIDVSFFRNVKFFFAEKHILEKLSSTVNTQGIILVAKIPENSSSNQTVSPFSLVLDRLGDPGNFGTILRTCASVGLKNVWYSTGSVDPYSEKTIRSAIAAQFALNLYQYEEINTLIFNLKALGYDKVFRTDPAEGKSCFTEEKLFEKSIIIFGNEANGIKEAASSIPINIPMPGKFESLNVAQAATVILFEAVRRKIFG